MEKGIKEVYMFENNITLESVFNMQNGFSMPDSSASNILRGAKRKEEKKNISENICCYLQCTPSA